MNKNSDTVFDYIKWRGDLTFEQDPFNEVDSFILTQVTFLDFSNIIVNEEMLLKDAIEAYFEIQNSGEKTKIDKQFQYNQYIRDFFENNDGKSLDDAIKCWKYKKSIKGHNKYEESDLEALL